MANSAEIIKRGNIAFGTSGARGLVEDFTPQICAAFTLAFLSLYKNEKRLAIAIDNRPSSPQIASHCINAAKSLGFSIDYYGVVPTPALAAKSMGDNIPSIMVTGSHIPFDRNGLKFYRPDGEITKEDERSILAAKIQVPDLDFNGVLPKQSLEAAALYIQRNITPFQPGLLTGKRIGIYEHSSAGRDLYSEIFTHLGAEVISLGRSDTFVPIDTEAVGLTDIQQAQNWQQEHNLDAIFSTDGDGDRPLLSDETGTYLRGDILCLLAAKYLNIEGLAVPVSCNSCIEESKYFRAVERTKIGSPFVIEAFGKLIAQNQNTAGFEANGGFLLASDIAFKGGTLKALPTRDAVLPALAVLAAASQSSISALVKSLPKTFTASDRLQHFSKDKSNAILNLAEHDSEAFLQMIGMPMLKVLSTDKTDGLRMTLSSGAIIHLRPSGNAPELRCYVESHSQSKADDLVKITLDKISNASF
ncbi:phosphomannomutase [Vibrio alfacsensis]|uniref:phosphomannomutase n=1 Tax=Vibrio alfacsensis TaxID=1074311 RepID=UPI00406879DC